MTAQKGDSYRYNGEEYRIVAMSEPMEFDPTKYGITPAAITTGCWAGYWCDYDITKEGLFLSNLYINASDGIYPDINGVSAITEPPDSLQYLMHHLYEDIQIPIQYTGRIVVGTGFMNEHYIHMGYQRAWAYKTLIEFVFEQGRLVETIDHSKDAARIRAEKTGRPSVFDEYDDAFSDEYDEDDDGIPKYITDSFSLDYKVKLWWLNGSVGHF